MNIYKQIWADDEAIHWVCGDSTFPSDHFKQELDSSDLILEQKRQLLEKLQPTKEAIAIMEESLADGDIDIDVTFSVNEIEQINSHLAWENLSVFVVFYPILTMLILGLLIKSAPSSIYNNSLGLILAASLGPMLILVLYALLTRNRIARESDKVVKNLRVKIQTEAHRYFQKIIAQRNRINNTKRMIEVLEKDIESSSKKS
ncbi:hypothetical protein IJG79_00460 [Candidatus Saccharibacteria bacterium]|nr:hypothetical protein [Candidatus Saccharibacteria bacterium]